MSLRARSFYIRLSLLAGWLAGQSAGVVGWAPSVSAQPSGAVERFYQDQDVRDQLDKLRPGDSKQRQPLIEGLPSNYKKKKQQPLEGPQQPEGPVIKGVELDGAQLFPNAQRQLLVKRFVGLPADAVTLQALQAAVSGYYVDNKLLAQAGTPRLETDGVVRVPVVEARLGRVRIASNKAPISNSWAIDTVLASIGLGREMRLDKLESALLKLNDLGGVRANANLEPGVMPGTTDVVLTLVAEKQILAEINLNNHATQYTGPYQAQLSVSMGSLLKRGEVFVFNSAYSGNIDWYGSRRLAGNANVPMTTGGLNLVGSYSWSDYRLLQQFTPDNYVGAFAAGTIGLNHVLWRRPKRNLSVQLIGEVDQFNDRVATYGEYSNRTNWVGRLSLMGDSQDKALNGIGLNSGMLTLSVGNLSKNALGESAFDAITMASSGAWGKLNLLYNRYQTFKKSKWTVELFAQAQGAFKNLDSAEKMSLGWPNGVRAYPPGEAAGDSGLAGQFTARYQLAKNVVLKGFVDGGYIWRWTNWFNSAQNPPSLALWGPGVGVEWGTRGDVLVSVDLAFPLGNNPSTLTGLDADGTNPDMRVWVSVRKWL